MFKVQLRVPLAGSFFFGGLLYGLPLAWAHIRHNQLASIWDSLVTGGAFLLIYGAVAAAVTLAVVLAVTLGWGLLPRLREMEGLERRALWWGLWLFQLGFWEARGLYGRTYEETPFGTLNSLGTMMAFLLAAALLIAALVTLVHGWLFRRLEGRLGGGRAKLWLGGAAGVGALVLVVTALVQPAGPGKVSGKVPGSSPAAQPPPVEVAETGLNVVLVGLDGADWRVLDPLMEAGELPTFSRFVEQGSRASLQSLPDANSAVLWASLYSGQPPAVHGVEDFYRIHLPGMKSRGLFPVHRSFFQEIADQLDRVGLVDRTLVTRYDHRAPPLWEVADWAGLTIGVVDGYLESFPAYRPQVEGSYFLSYGLDSFVANLGRQRPGDVELFLQPKELLREIRDLATGGDFFWQAKTSLALLRQHPQPRLLNLYTHEPDSVQHTTWKWYEPRFYPWVRTEGEEARKKARAIPEMYRQFDRFLAQLEGAVGPQTVIVVASDHGHVPTFVHKLYTQHRHGPPGVLLLKGGPVRAGQVLSPADVYDLFPTLLYLLGLPVPEDGAGRVLTDGLEADFVASHPIRTLPTYSFLGPGSGGGAGLDEERNRQELEKLKSLGYI
jgi:hypothetical protein